MLVTVVGTPEHMRTYFGLLHLFGCLSFILRNSVWEDVALQPVFLPSACVTSQQL
jgi:hypothetical protein